MHIERVPNRNSPPAVLLRQSYREGGKVRKRTLANLSKLPADAVEGLRILLKGGTAIPSLESAFEIQRSLPHGHVAAVLGTLSSLGLQSLISTQESRQRDLVTAMIVARILDPASKLATARGLSTDTISSTLGQILGVQSADSDELYEAMDWLLERQEEIERCLAAKHLEEGSLILYDVTSTYFEGTTCPLAQYGYSRDKKKGKLQIIFGLLCNAVGCPIAVEVFEGNINDAKTLSPLLEKVRHRFGIQRVVLVGDRGILTEARIEEELKGVEGLDWITALRAPQIRELVEQDALQLSLFDQRDLASIQSPDYPGERLIACRNPFLAEERAATREALLQATEKELEKIFAATTRSNRPLVGAEKIGVRVGKVINRYQVAKHFNLKITDDHFSYERNSSKIETEAKLDGIYVIRTSVPAFMLDERETVKAYKSLSQVEAAFRCYKTVDLKVRPIYHRLANRVRAHVFLCLLAYYVEWHMRQRLAPLLFEDEEWLAPQESGSVVVPVKLSTPAQRKASTQRTSEKFPVQSFRTLLTNLSTIAKNRVQPKLEGISVSFDKLTTPTPLQQKALDLLGVSLTL
ncbi:MAG TPA: IS1634 family transposase [Coleofasciculaceae cyanobacterium]|jgi:transposase